jgi:hypothetical protein
VVDDGAREVGVLGQEAVARVHGIRTAVSGRLKDLRDVQVAVGRRLPTERVGLIGHGDVQRI